MNSLLAELSSLHDEALTREPSQLQRDKERFLAVVERTRRGTGDGRTLSDWLFNPWGRALLAAAALGATFLVGLRLGEPPVAPIAPERPVVATPATPVAASVAAPVAACTEPLRLTGGSPRLDDFEDGDSMILSHQQRNGAWMLFKDSDPPGIMPLLTPTRRPQATVKNQKALHLVSGELRDWGAVAQVDFKPTCYDVSVYAGIEFAAKGPGRLYVGARQPSVVPAKWGGTCTEDCYDTHQKKVELSTGWHRYRVQWEEMRQRGYDTPPLDTSRVHGIAFTVQAGDTPFDLWLDDVTFASRAATAVGSTPERNGP